MKAALFLLLAALPARAATFTLTVSTSGPAGNNAVLTSTPSGIVCPGACAASFTAGSTVTVGEVSLDTVAFVAWGAPCRSNLPACTLPLTANTVLTANFDPLLAVAVAGSGIGAVSISSQPVCSSSGTCANGAARLYAFPTGSTVVLTASTGEASAFNGWSGDAGCATASTCTVTLNGYEAIVATFSANGVGPYPLAVAVPAGGGTVTSTPAGIQTGAGAYRSTFTANSFVTLATAAAAGYRFAGWANGGCSGLSPCVVQSTSPLQGLGDRHSPAAYFLPAP